MKTEHKLLGGAIGLIMLLGYGMSVLVYAHSTFVEEDKFTAVMSGIEARLTGIQTSINERCGR